LNRKLYSILFLVVLALVIFGAWYFYFYPHVLKESFEVDFGEWITDADVPLDPNNPGNPVEWSITRATNIVHSGEYSLRFFVDGRQDDGTIWVERKIEVKKNSRVQGEVSFEFYSETKSFNTIAAVVSYIGINNSEGEADFAVLGPANEVAGWKKYIYTATIQTDSSGEVWVAIGISVTWETHMTYYIDDVEIRT
jgi:hypothetical protein